MWKYVLKKLLLAVPVLRHAMRLVREARVSSHMRSHAILARE